MHKKILVCVLASVLAAGCSRSPAPAAAEPTSPPPPPSEAARLVAQVTEQKNMRDDRIAGMVSRAILTADGR